MTGGEFDQLRFLAGMIVELQTALHEAERTIAALRPPAAGVPALRDDVEYAYVVHSQ